ncbi:MAG: type II toxin-antitoxin system RelE/ParE family toxin [Desulfuromonadales bacterium]|nr:type II toxin-antitoxin system RelE/ParE family toxin [Chloroflexota bacterium]MCK4622294.1 type II toxin-antitoxin system RelE/ParE family toxin [Desulfuromonadales bacterium]
MRYRIELTPAVEKALGKLAKSSRPLLKRIDRALLDLAENPIPSSCKQLAGEDPLLYRLRVGDYRILYKIEDDVLVILVVHIGHRKDVYRFLKR